MNKTKLRKVLACVGLAAVMMTQTVFAEVSTGIQLLRNNTGMTVMSDTETSPVVYRYEQANYGGYGHKKTLNDDGSVTYNVVTPANGRIYLNIPTDTTVSADNSAALYMKIKNESNAVMSWKVYYQTSTATGFIETKTGMLMPCGLADEDGYTLYELELQGKTGWSGDVGQLMIYIANAGTYTIADSYLYAAAESVTLNASATSITEDGGSITLTPTVTFANGAVENKVNFETSTVNGKLTVNADGTATVTGQVNGEMKITAWRDDCDMTADVTITISGQSDRIADVKKKIRFYGNSIAIHGPAPGIGKDENGNKIDWTGNWGMAASSQDKDYVHRLVAMLEGKYGTGSIENLGNFATHWEGAVKNGTADSDLSWAIDPIIADATTNQPDIIIFQLGENAGSPSAALYERAMSEVVTGLRNAVPGVQVAITTPFWGGATLKDGALAAAGKLDIPIAQLHTLHPTLYPENGDARFGNHPSDVGMEKIATMFFEVLNKNLSLADDIEYSKTPTSFSFTDGIDTIATADATVQLGVSVLPEGASQDVIWSVDNEKLAKIDSTGKLTAINNGTVTVTAKHRLVPTLTLTRQIVISNQSEPNTVTYDKNTTDTVEGMPEQNEWAKNGFELSTSYPSRTYYRFAGWMNAPEGTVLGKTIDVTQDTTVYAKWEYADKWSFDIDNYFAGFTVDNGYHNDILDGKFPTTHTNNKIPKFKSPLLNIDTAKYDMLVLNLQNDSIDADTTLDMTIKTTAGDYQYSRSITTTEFTDYAFDLSGMSGTITGIEFSASNKNGAVATVDEIAFRNDAVVGYRTGTTDDVTNMPSDIYDVNELPQTVSNTIPERSGFEFLGWTLTKGGDELVAGDYALKAGDRLYAVWGDVSDAPTDPAVAKSWEFNSKAQISSWTPDGDNMTMTDMGDGTLKFVGYGNFQSPKNLNLTIGNEPGQVRYVRVRVKNTTPENNNFIYFTTDTVSTFTSGVCVEYDSPGNQTGYSTILIDMAKSDKWTGTLKQFRFDTKTDTKGGDGLYLDKIELLYAGAAIEEVAETVYEQNFDADISADDLWLAGITKATEADWNNESSTSKYIIKDGKLFVNPPSGGIWAINPKVNGASIWETGKSYHVEFDQSNYVSSDPGKTQAVVWIFRKKGGSAGNTMWAWTHNGPHFKSDKFVYTSEHGYVGFKNTDAADTLEIDNIVIKEYKKPLPTVSELSGVYNNVTGIDPNGELAVAMTDTLGSTVPTVTFAETGSTVGSNTVTLGAKSGTKSSFIVKPTGLDYGKTYTMTVNGLTNEGGEAIPEFTITFTTEPKPHQWFTLSDADNNELSEYSSSLKYIKFNLKDNDATGKMAIVAAYATDGRLISAETATFTDGVATHDVAALVNNQNVKTIKSFLWTSDIAPITGALVLAKP